MINLLKIFKKEEPTRGQKMGKLKHKILKLEAEVAAGKRLMSVLSEVPRSYIDEYKKNIYDLERAKAELTILENQ